VSFLNNSLKAKELFKKDKDYVVMNGEVLIVDEFTGRILHGRRYNEGMHQAIEAKEGVQIKDENQTFATITLQNYFRLYDKLSGMTGTAMTEANEFMQIYKLGVVPIPTNKPMIRADETDVIFQTGQAKFDAVVSDIVDRNAEGQPVLVGTTSVEKSELLSVLLKRRGIEHHVLNAKYHEQEAMIIAQSGRLGAVTVATNMAGRGTDIMLGGNPDFIADLELHQRGLSPVDTPEDYEAAWPEAVAKAKAAVAAEHEQVVGAGGLYVLGTERHESRRIDNQLRGRSGRQGDPGLSRFYLSLEDDLMRMFNSERVAAIMDRLHIPADVPVENSVVSRSIRSAQTQVESQNFEIRKDVLKYDDVLNRQRQVIYGERREVLEGADLHEQVRSMIDEVTASYVTAATAEGYPEEWDLDKLWKAFKQLFPITLKIDAAIEEAGGDKGALTADLITDLVQENAQEAYDHREAELTPELMREIERRVVLSVLDRKWREHLYEMDYLREGIGLRAMAQRDPLVEYQREGFDMFNAMMDGIREESVGNLFNLQFEVQENPIVEEVGAGAQLSFGGTLPGVTTAPGVTAGATAPSPAGQPPAPQVAAAQSAAPAPAAPGRRARPPRPAPAAVPEQAAPAAFGKKPAAGPQPAAGRTRGRHAADGRGHATAAGRGQAATRSTGAHATRPAQSVPAEAADQEVLASEASGPQAVLPAELAPHRPAHLEYSAPAEDGGVERHAEDPADEFAGVGRNDLCPCGSGRKFKRCHGGRG
jgi:preprotein translocase subunit SecA